MKAQASLLGVVKGKKKMASLIPPKPLAKAKTNGGKGEKNGKKRGSSKLDGQRK